MPTQKQENAVAEMVENGGIASKAMRDVGYSVNTAKSPSKLTNSKGYKELCEKYGLTEKLIITALVSDIEEKPKKRIEELKLGAKIIGLSEDAGININFDNRRIIVTRGESGLVPKPTNEVAQTSPEPMGELPVQDTSGREEGA